MVEMILQKQIAIKDGVFRISIFDDNHTGLLVFDSTDGCETLNHVTETDLISIHAALTDVLDQLGVDHA